MQLKQSRCRGKAKRGGNVKIGAAHLRCERQFRWQSKRAKRQLKTENKQGRGTGERGWNTKGKLSIRVLGAIASLMSSEWRRDTSQNIQCYSRGNCALMSAEEEAETVRGEWTGRDSSGATSFDAATRHLIYVKRQTEAGGHKLLGPQHRLGFL